MDDSNRQAGDLTEVEISPAMIAVGVERLNDLLSAGTSAAYVVEEVFLAMAEARV